MSLSFVRLWPAQAALSGPGGKLGVVVAAVVVVIAIAAVIIMVVRNSGGGKKVARGIGYDPRQGPIGQPQQEYTDQPPWARPGALNGQAGGPAGFGQQGGWQAGGAQGGFAQQAPAQGWGQMPPNPQMAQQAGGAWGQNAAPAWGDPAAQAAPQQQWGQPAPANPTSVSGWDVPGGPPGGQSASQPNWAQPWGQAEPAAPAAPAWGQAEPATPAWSQPQPPAQQAWGQQEPGAPAWSQQPAAGPASAPWGNEAPGHNASQGNAGAGPWEMPAPAQGGGNWGGAPAMADAAPQTPWGQPAAPQAPPAPQQQGFGAAQPPAGGFDNNGFGPFGSPLAAPPQQQAAASKRPGVLLVKQGKEPGRVYEFHNDRLTIGRSRDSDIFLEDLAVSRLHATVFRDSTGQYIVRDENSANGTTVNGMRIGEQPLNENDEIALGQTVLVFQRR